MPEWMEKRGEGLAKHLNLKSGSERYNAVKYGTMRKLGWTPGEHISQAAKKLRG